MGFRQESGHKGGRRRFSLSEGGGGLSKEFFFEAKGRDPKGCDRNKRAQAEKGVRGTPRSQKKSDGRQDGRLASECSGWGNGWTAFGHGKREVPLHSI